MPAAPEQFDLLAGDSALWPLIAAAVVTLAAIPLLRRVAVRLELYDRPDAGLKPHERPIPYLGGVAIYLGWLTAAVLYARHNGDGGCLVGWIGLGGTILMLVGLIDDVRGLPPTLRLLVQVGVAGVLVYAGVGQALLPALLNPLHESLPGWLAQGVTSTALSFALTAAVLVGVTNATNLIDGLDGLCAGVVAIASCGFLAEAWLLGRANVISGGGDTLIVMLCVGMLGGCLAFLVFNFNPASMFMGDNGSLLLGFSVAVVVVLFAEHASWRGLLAALVCFGFPILDMLLAVGRRWRNGRPLFIGDRSHFYDQIRDRGLSVRQSVLVCYGLGLFFAVLGLLLTQLSGVWAAVLFTMIPFAGALACWRGGMLRVDDAAERSDHDAGGREEDEALGL